jgi:hypothetical protein
MSVASVSSVRSEIDCCGASGGGLGAGGGGGGAVWHADRISAAREMAIAAVRPPIIGFPPFKIFAKK